MFQAQGKKFRMPFGGSVPLTTYVWGSQIHLPMLFLRPVLWQHQRTDWSYPHRWHR